MAQQTRYLPAITAGTRQTRSFSRGFGNFQFRYRTALQVINRSATATAILYVDGDEVRRVPPVTVGVFDEDVAIYSYQVDATANTSANELEILEDGGLDESVESQIQRGSGLAYEV